LNTALRGIHEARENLLGIARLTGEDKTAQRAEPTTIQVVYVQRPLPQPTAPVQIVDAEVY
jgi:hypothetical protein